MALAEAEGQRASTKVLDRLKVMDATMAQVDTPAPPSSSSERPVVVMRPVEVSRPIFQEAPIRPLTAAGAASWLGAGLLVGMGGMGWMFRRAKAEAQRQGRVRMATETALAEAHSRFQRVEQANSQLALDVKKRDDAIAELQAAVAMATTKESDLNKQCVSLGVKLTESLDEAEGHRRELMALQKISEEQRQTLTALHASVEESRQREQHAQAQATAAHTELQRHLSEHEHLVESLKQAQEQIAAQAAQLQEASRLIDSNPALVSQREMDAVRHAYAGLEQRYAQSEWYLGEARATLARLSADVETVTGKMEQVDAQLAQTSKQRDEANWYLAEARGAREAQRQQIDALQRRAEEAETTREATRAELAQARQARDEANWYLGETKAAHERLTADLEQRGAQIESLRNELDQERRVRANLESQFQRFRDEALKAGYSWWDGVERRRSVRVAHAEPQALRAELFDPETGKRVARGAVTNTSERGLGVQLAFLPLLGRLTNGRARCRFAAADGSALSQEIEGRVIWQHRSGRSGAGEAGLTLDQPLSLPPLEPNPNPSTA